MSVIYDRYPDTWASLRSFSLFAFNLDSESMLQGHEQYSLLGYLIVNRSHSGCLCWVNTSQTWLLQLNQSYFQGDYFEMLEKALGDSYFIVAVIYAKNIKIPQIKIENFMLLQKKLIPYIYSTSEIFELPEFGEVVYKDTFKSLGKCICGNELYSSACSICGETLGCCEKCGKNFYLKDICCLRCEGVIVDGTCQVCELKQNALECLECLQVYWRCEICFYPNIGCTLCRRCSNPPENSFKDTDFI